MHVVLLNTLTEKIMQCKGLIKVQNASCEKVGKLH